MKNWQIWDEAPSLLYGLSFLLGWLFALTSALALLPWFLLVATAKKQLPLLVALFLLPLPLLHQMPQKNSGYFHIDHIEKKFGWSYRGSFNHRPVVIRSNHYYKPNRDYFLEGSWNEKGRFEPTSWRRTAYPSFAYMRGKLQKKIKLWLHRHFHYEDSATLMGGMMTGKMDDLELKKRCQMLGLSHLLAVSGFHFALLYFFLHTLLKCILPRTALLITLGICMTLFALFVGSSPSTLRAWLFMILYLIGEFSHRKTSALNLLGMALLISLLIHPFSCASLSFQLSFLATGGIFLFYRPIQACLFRYIPKHDVYYIVSQKSLSGGLWDQCKGIVRDLFALTLAVHLTTFPLLLYHFHLIWIHSLFYNLFYPLLFSIAVLLLPLYPICDLYTHVLLKGIYNPPIFLPPLTIALENWMMMGLLTGLIGWGLFKMERKKERQLFSCR